MIQTYRVKKFNTEKGNLFKEEREVMHIGEVTRKVNEEIQ